MIRNIMPAISWSAFVLFISLIPGNEIPEFENAFTHIDKIAHAILFAGLSFLWVFGLRKSKVYTVFKSKIDFIISLGTFLFGFGIELVQHYYIPQRFFDIYDVIANGFGILLGFSFFYIVIYKRN